MTFLRDDYLKTYFEHTIPGPPLGMNEDLPTGSWGPLGIRGAYAKKIGSTFGGLLPSPDLSGVCKPTRDSVNYGGGTLRCYQESGLSIHINYSDSFGCFFDTTEVTGIQNVMPLSRLVQVYPNPAHEVINVVSKMPFSNPATLLLLDVAGRKLKTILIKTGQHKLSIPVSDLPEGLYYLNLKIGKQSYGQKIIIKRE